LLGRGSFTEEIDDGLCTVGATCPGPEFTAFTRVEGQIAIGANAGLTTAGENVFDFTCETRNPFVEIEKKCASVDLCDSQDQNEITVVVTNTGEGGATACSVSDILDPGGLNTPVPLLSDPSNPPGTNPANFDLPPGESRTFTAAVQVPPGETSVNDRAIVECEDVCEPGDPTCQTEDFDEATCTCGHRDNYKCYTVKTVPRTPRFPATTVGLEDQFRTTEARLLAPYQLCNPVDKNGEGIENPDAHLLCYKFVDRSRSTSVPVEVTDQFGTEQLRTSSANLLCVPALKNCDPETQTCSIGALEEELNHFQCYGALPLLRDQDLLTPADVELADQFTEGTATFPPARRRHLCTPTAKNGGFVPDEEQHLKCYSIRDEQPFLGTEVEAIDQFGTWNLRVGQARSLCESAEKTRLDRRPVDDTRSRSRRGP